jgi:hypothetical protein
VSIKTFFNELLGKETNQIAPISVYRVETPDKIVETKIQPVKIPNIFDVSERLANLAHDISALKNDMVSRSWFKDEFQDISPSITDKLNEISAILRSLQTTINNFTNLFSSKLSNFTKDGTSTQFSDLNRFNVSLGISGIIYEIIKTHEKIRYKDIIKSVPASDPTLSKYLKILVSENKIRRIKVGKAVYYEVV